MNVVSRLQGVTSDGQVVMGIYSPGHRNPGDVPHWSFDADASRWSQLPGSGVGVEDECLAGDRLVVVTGTRVNGGAVVASPTDGSSSGLVNDPELRLFDVRDPSAGWQATTAIDGHVYNTPELACGGDFALLHGGLGDDVLVAPVSPGSTWEVAPSPPSRQVFTASMWTGEDLLVLSDDGAGGLAAVDMDP